MDYNLNLLPSFNIINYFCNAGLVTKNELENELNHNEYAEESFNLYLNQLQEQCFYIYDCFMKDDRYLDFANDQLLISCSILAFVRNKNGLNPWSNEFESAYDIKYSDFESCYVVLKSIFSPLLIKKKIFNSNNENAKRKRNYTINVSPIQKEEDKEPFLPSNFIEPFILNDRSPSILLKKKSGESESQSIDHPVFHLIYNNSTLDNSIVNSTNILQIKSGIKFTGRRSSVGPSTILY